MNESKLRSYISARIKKAEALQTKGEKLTEKNYAMGMDYWDEGSARLDELERIWNRFLGRGD